MQLVEHAVSLYREIMSKEQKHEKSYEQMPNGGRVRCTCGWTSTIVDDSNAFILGRKVKSADQQFEEHIKKEETDKSVETTMVRPVAEHATAPAQKSQARKPKR